MRNKLGFLLIWLLLSMSGCSYENLPPCSAVPARVSFHSDVLPIFNNTCSLPECHSGKMPTGGLNLTADSAFKYLMNPGKGYIDSLRPEYSLLYNKLVTTTNRMPPGNKLDSCSIALIERWIAQGALNN